MLSHDVKNGWIALKTYSDMSPDLNLRRQINQKLLSRPEYSSHEWHQRFWAPIGVRSEVVEFVYHVLEECSGLTIGRLLPSDRMVADLQLSLVCWFDWEIICMELFWQRFDPSGSLFEGLGDLTLDAAPTTFETLRDWMGFLNQAAISSDSTGNSLGRNLDRLEERLPERLRSRPMEQSIQLDAVRSQQLGKAIASKPNTPFDNAANAAIALFSEVGEAEDSDVHYVQGFLVRPGEEPSKPIEHAWVEIKTADIATRIDPSFRHLKLKEDELSYFPAHYLAVPSLQAAIEEAKEDYPEDPPLPIYSAMPYEFYGDLMLGDKTYKIAFEAAQTKCTDLNRPARPTLKKSI